MTRSNHEILLVSKRGWNSIWQQFTMLDVPNIPSLHLHNFLHFRLAELVEEWPKEEAEPIFGAWIARDNQYVLLLLAFLFFHLLKTKQKTKGQSVPNSSILLHRTADISLENKRYHLWDHHKLHERWRLRCTDICGV